jgi:ornithine cyclodeaminase/alanine dehydrogenase-like protein (mu-crystallin family)
MLVQLAPEVALLVAGRNESSVTDLVRHACDQGLNASAASSMESATAHADLIITATSSRTSVIPDCVRNDAIVVAVGNYRPDATELPKSLVIRSRCYADSLQGAKHEAGEYLLAGVDWSAVQALDTHFEWQLDRTRPAIVKSVGSAAWDLAWARAFLQMRANSQ